MDREEEAGNQRKGGQKGIPTLDVNTLISLSVSPMLDARYRRKDGRISPVKPQD